jgi:hypothetical protein
MRELSMAEFRLQVVFTHKLLASASETAKKVVTLNLPTLQSACYLKQRQDSMQ